MSERGGEYLTKLTDRKIKSRWPDGGEIVDALNSVVVTETVWDWYTHTTGVGQFWTPIDKQSLFLSTTRRQVNN